MNFDVLGLEPRRPEVLDSSILKDFINCPAYCYLRHILGLRKKFPPGTGEAKFDWGTCWHTIMEEYTANDYDQGAGLAALEANYPEYITPLTDKKKRSKERMAKAFFDYVEKFKESDIKSFEIIRQEQYFDIENLDEDLRWCGRIDDIRRRTGSGRIIVNDYKTSSAMGANYFSQHERGFQFPGYVWAANQMFTGEEVTKIMIDVMYMITASHDFFRRTFPYDKYRIAEWVHNVKLWSGRFWHLCDTALNEPEKWGLNWNHCTNYGICDFFPIHNLTPKGASRASVIMDAYEVEYWDPRKENKKHD